MSREAVVHARPGLSGAVAFDRSPFIVIWETTRACALACVHCRASAMPRRDPRELTTEEGRALLERIAAFGEPPPLVVLTGGDPLRRPDVADLVAHGTRLGLSMSLTPSGTGAATAERLRALRDAGLARLAVSLDGATAAAHDAFRRVQGSHRHTLRIVEEARALGLPLQINTTVCRQTVADLPALAEQVAGWGVVLWALFFLIPVGRAQADQALPADDIERVLGWAADLQRRFALRGYSPGDNGLIGHRARLGTIEYRVPLADVDRATMLPPVGMNRVSMNVFADAGAAWDSGEQRRWRRGYGVELLVEARAGYLLGAQLRAGVAHGVDENGRTVAYLRIGRSF